METLDQKISTSPTRVSTPTYDDVASRLMWHYANIVMERGASFSPVHKSYFASIAKWLNGKGRRGLILWGAYGTGKSTMLKAIKRFYNTDMNLPADMYTATELCERGTDDLYCKGAGSLLIIDELGREENERKIFGNTSEPLIRLLCGREERMYPTLIATNLTDKELREKYSEYVYDRLKGYCNRIYFNGKSYRT